MSFRYRFSEEDCLEIAGAAHRLVKSSAAGSVWARIDMPSVTLSFTSDEICQLLSEPNVRLKRGHYAHAAAILRLQNDYEYLQTVAAEKRSRAVWQARCAQVFLEAEAKGEVKRREKQVDAMRSELRRRVDELEERAQDVGRSRRAGQIVTRRRFPCARSLLQWVRLFEVSRGSPLIFLHKSRRDVHPKGFSTEVELLLAECVEGYLDRNEPTQQTIVNNTKDRFAQVNAARAKLGDPSLPTPSARTVRRRIKALDPYEVMVQRKGLEVARQKFGFYEEGIPAAFPLERVEMDEWRIDLISLLGESGALDFLTHDQRSTLQLGRRWLYVALDCATRCVVGFRIAATPSSRDAIKVLHLITQDKTGLAGAAGCESTWHQYGGIGSLVADQGTSYVAETFRTAVTDLGSTYEAPPAGVPKLRARVERIFRTLGTHLMSVLIGRTFSGQNERGDYPSEEWASLTDDELAQILTLFFVDIYHNTPHGGLKGETPANAWKRLARAQGVTPPPDANQARAVFGIPLERKLGRHGIRVVGINYTAPELQDALLRGANGPFQVRLDSNDLTAISVCIGHVWVSALAVSDAVHGLSLCEWQSMIRDLRTRFRKEAAITEPIIRAARKKIRDIDARARELRRVMPTQLTSEQLEREEAQLFLGLNVGPDGSAALPDEQRSSSEGLLSDVILSSDPSDRADQNPEIISAHQHISVEDDWTFDD